MTKMEKERDFSRAVLILPFRTSLPLSCTVDAVSSNFTSHIYSKVPSD